MLIIGIAGYSLNYLLGEEEAPRWLPQWIVRVFFRPVMVVIGLITLILIMLSALFWPIS